MAHHSPEQLDKVLALADSSHEAEAVVAVRKARQMLSRDGLNFSDLARAASTRAPFNKAFSIFSGANTQLEAQVIQMRQTVAALQSDIQTQTIQLEFWRRRAAELEQHFNVARSDAERWRQLARDTVEKLWDLGQEVKADEVAADVLRAAPAEKKSA